MITTVEELQTVRALYTQVYTDLQQQQQAVPTNVRTGIMVEVPAAAIMATELAELADFFSIGANDLLQYTLAADRTNAALATLYNPLQPAVLRLIAQIAQASQRAGKPVAVCGEMAGDARLALVLVALGVTELSMAPTALPAIRKVLTGKTREALNQLAQHVLTLKTAAEVEAACTGI
jgi:phosphoenolpyruvate-protein kinase (PTS system EI component)